MTILLKHVEPWPISLARDDLAASVALYYYARYGLNVRAALEIEGPYEFAARDVRYMNAMGLLSVGPARDAKARFEQHRTVVTQAASYQFLLSCYSIFEFLIANITLFVYLGCKGRGLSKGFRFVWDPAAQATFLSDTRVSDIEDDAWMKRHHRDDEVKERLRLLDDVCRLQLTTFTVKAGASSLGWDFFRRHRRLRHSIVHTSARSSLYSRGDMARKAVKESLVLHLHEYLSALLTHVNRRLYEVPVIDFVHS